MPLFESDRATFIWGATAVSNAFICEYMPAAPEGHVKVYLYGLMYAIGGSGDSDASISDVARALSMDTGEVERALRYWERCRLVERVKDNPPEYRFLGVQKALMQRRDTPGDEAYEAFAQAIYAAFGDRRKLHGGETVLAYEWVEQMKLPPEVVIMLIQHMIATRGVNFGFKEAQKVALELREQNATTIEAAETLFSRSEAAWKGARRILNRLGMRRSPSLDELDLYIKWTGEWKFSPKAIEAACAETTKGKPTFGYLDGIMRGLYERSGGSTGRSDSEVKRQIEAESGEGGEVRRLLAALGISSEVIDEGMRLIYRDMLKAADADVIYLAAQEVGKRSSKSRTLDNVTRLLDSWNDKGLKTVADVTAYLKAIDADNTRLAKLFEIAGVNASGSPAKRDMLHKWRDDWGLSDALIDVAAELSRGVASVMPYMDKLLSGWRDENALTPEAARAANKRYKEKAASAGERKPDKKLVNEQNYEQRTYDPADFEGYTPEQLEEMKKL